MGCQKYYTKGKAGVRILTGDPSPGGKPLIFLYHDTEVIPGAKARRPYLVTKDNIREMLEYISNYSYMRASRRCGRIYHDRRRTQSGIVGTGYYGKWEGKESEIHFFSEYPCGNMR